LNQAIKLDPWLALALRNRGDVWVAKHELRNAMADYDAAIRLDRRAGAVFCGRGRLWLLKHDYGKAIADFGEAIRLDPQEALAYEARGTAWFHKKQFDKTIVDYEKVRQLDPSLLSPLVTCAWIWACCPDAKLRDGKKAVESATKACELSNWKDAYVVGILAAAYAETGDFDMAQKLQTKSNALSSGIFSRMGGRLQLKLYQMKEPRRDDALKLTGSVQ
jgi:tetratricopeptide (TPR) repeat protein